MTKTELKKAFVSALKNSIKYDLDNLTINDDEKAYFDSRYFSVIKKEFDRRGIKSLETKSKKREPSICSFASSARLAFADYMLNKGAVFEKSLSNDIKPHPSTSKMDIVCGNVFYECKCQEIICGEHHRLKGSYLRSDLFRSFGFPLNGDNIDHNGYFDFTMNDLGLDINSHYYDLHFNFKQLICHLIAIAKHNHGEKSFLKYVVYKPAEAYIKDSLVELYDEFDKEVDAIWSIPQIVQFCKDNSIELMKPEDHFINLIEDKVYMEAYNV